MEVIPKRRSEIISLADQYKEQIENRKDGVRIGTKQFQCTCCICGNHFIRNRKACYFCEAEFCQRINKSYRDEQYRKSEKGQATRRKNRKSPITIETRKRYEQISRGGTNARENLVMCCQSCNSHKNNRTESEYYEWRKNHNERFIKNARS